MIFRNIKERESCFGCGSFGALYAAVIILSLHWALVLYINSSYLEQYVSQTTIGLLYTVGSALTIGAFILVSRALSKKSNYYITLILSLLELKVLFTMAFVESSTLAIALFLLHQAIVPLILFNLDIYMEEMIGENEATTGKRRGFLLAIMSLAGALGPLLAGKLVHLHTIADSISFFGLTHEFSSAYILSGMLMLPFIGILIYQFRRFKEPEYKEFNFGSAFRRFWFDSDIRNVCIAHFLLQLFFSWMVIYTPLYLSNIIGLSWNNIGLVIFSGLIAYVFLEYPIGIIADRWIGEKEMMALGFLIIAISTSWIAVISDAPVAAWMFVMFMTRVGASLVETTTESYFFKHTNGADPSMISFFRITRPLAYVVGALLGSVIIASLKFEMLFIVLGFIVTLGLFFTMMLKDTR